VSSGVARMWCQGGTTIDSPKAPSGVGYGEGCPIPSPLGGLGSVVSFSSGSGAEPRSLSHFLHVLCHRTLLVAQAPKYKEKLVFYMKRCKFHFEKVVVTVTTVTHTKLRLCSGSVIWTALVQRRFKVHQLRKLTQYYRRLYCVQHHPVRLASTVTTRCSGPNVLPVTWFWWRQRCTDACRSVAASRPTSASSAARLTSSSTCIGAARAGASVTSACLTPPSTVPSLATRTSRAIWKSHTHALKVAHACLRHQTASNGVRLSTT